MGRKFTAGELAILVDAWRSKDGERLAATSRAAGVEVTRTLVEGIERADAFLAPEVVLSTIGAALSYPAGIAVREDARRVVLVVVDRARARLVVAIGCLPKAGDGVKKTWPALSPWYKDLARNRPRIDAWLANPVRESPYARGWFALELVEPERDDDDALPPQPSALLAAILANPEDDGPRLVLADLLQQRGDAHGELIAIQCRRTRGASAAVRERERVLLDTHGAAIAGDVARCTHRYRIARGFVAAVEMAAPTFAANGARLFAQHPIEELRLRPVSIASVAKLARTPALAHVRRLVLALDPPRSPPVDLAPLWSSPHLAALETLVVRNLDCPEWTGLGRANAPRLRSLVLGGPSILDETLPAIRHANLRALELAGTAVTEGALLAWLRSTAGAELERLHVHDTAERFDPARLAAAIPSSHPLRVVALPGATALPARFVAPS